MEWNRNEKIGLLLALVSFTFLLLDMLLLEKIFLKVKKFKVGDNSKNKHLTIVQISDLHFKNHYNWKYKILLSKIKEIKPDLLIITGDALDRQGHIPPLEKFLSKLPKNISKIAILGNHDYVADVSNEQLIKIYKSFGIDYLVNESKIYNFNDFNLAITGLDDFMEGTDNFEKSFSNLNGEKNHIILAHNPKHVDRISPFLRRINHLQKENVKPQLLLSGHTHGGQIKLNSYTPGLPVSSGKYVDGWYDTDIGQLYINKGIGTSTLPLRLGARSEVTIFDYYPE